MSYTAPEWVRGMAKERWGRLVEDQESFGDKGLVWSPNNRPLELANEYLAVVEWAANLERQLDHANKLLDDIHQKFAPIDMRDLEAHVKQNYKVLAVVPSGKRAAPASVPA